MRILAIDPGPVESAYVIMDDYKPVAFGKIDNHDILGIVDSEKRLIVEMVSHYGTGMPAGKTVFDTCVWIGRFIERMDGTVDTILRATVKTHLCGMARAKDGNVIQALCDRFGEKGTKKHPGWFYGFAKDVWQAYALGVAWMDAQEAEE